MASGGVVVYAFQLKNKTKYQLQYKGENTFHGSIRALRTYLKHHGVDYHFRMKKTITSKRHHQALVMEMYHCGMTCKDVSTKMRVSRKTVKDWYNNLYLPEIHTHGYKFIITIESKINGDN